MPGTYVLLLTLADQRSLQIGKLGRYRFRKGRYCYVGSAFGPGGLAARLAHHARRAARPHWHIDYLRSACELHSAWYSQDGVRHEHVWAALLSALDGVTRPVSGFGASDCTCKSHLIQLSPGLRIEEISKQLQSVSNHLARYSAAQLANL